MSETKHTPGPWFANGTYVSKIRGNGYTLPITRVYNQKSGSPGVEPDMSLTEAEANARLIAAAPDLLAACKDMLADVDRYQFRGGTLTEAEAAHVVAMRAAVARAAGEES